MKSPCRILKLLFVATYILAISSCADEKCTNPPNERAYIYGYAYLDGAETYSDILVRIIQTGDSTYTDVSGRYQFSLQSPDTYTVVASYPEYSPSFTVIHLIDNQPYQGSDLELYLLGCYPRDSLPDGYPLGVSFTEDISFAWNPDYYFIGDSLFIVGFEYFQPPFSSVIKKINNHDFDLIVISSLGDIEKTPVFRQLGSIPEVWQYGYIVGSALSTIPSPYNGIIEIEPSGGCVIAMYHSYWLKMYVCNSIGMVP